MSVLAPLIDRKSSYFMALKLFLSVLCSFVLVWSFELLKICLSSSATFFHCALITFGVADFCAASQELPSHSGTGCVCVCADRDLWLYNGTWTGTKRELRFNKLSVIIFMFSYWRRVFGASSWARSIGHRPTGLWAMSTLVVNVNEKMLLRRKSAFGQASRESEPEPGKA